MRQRPMRFGVFTSPWHVPGRNPTLHFQQDLELCEHLDRLGFDEIWWGEHHSGGMELVAAPDVFVAAAAERTRRLMLGLGVTSLPYHHPLIVADRITMLDHLTRGRVVFGFGPGSLVQDSQMMGLDVNDARPRLEASVDAIVRLLEDDEPVNVETEWFTLRDARLNLHPFTYPRMELATASIRSPSGPRLAGRYGMSLLSLAPTEGAGFEFLKDTWRLTEDEAAQAGRCVRRDDWRVVATVHLAPKLEEAVEEARYGFDGISRFWAAARSGPPAEVDIEDLIAAKTHEERVHAANAATLVIGTPQMAIDLIERLREQSGGFGTFLISLADIADRRARLRSLELFAHEVIPHFQGTSARPTTSWDRLFTARQETGALFRAAQDNFTARHEQEQGAKARPRAGG